MLKKDNEYGAKKITLKLIELFEAARGGVKDKRIKDHATLLAVCDVLHVVGPPGEGQSVLPCEGNPCGFGKPNPMSISRNQPQSATITWRICSRRASASFHRPPLAHAATAALKLITFGLTH